MKQKDRIL